ncbi:thioredoxin [Roseobacter phage RD-1410Ws-07]|uniref:Thioredoxin n=1 Tax=Roseobacter phage RD-1410Ws-07 TaxID=1815985 RepID=A0A191VYQ9_9CAUD|nr:thioredoxin [Roseobacter phage RD-1410Ws-07]
MLDKVDDTTFAQKVRQADGYVMVLFTGSWCQPCKKFKPVFEQFLGNFPHIKGYEADVESTDQFATELNVRSLPSLVLFSDGMIVDVKSGTMTKEDLRLWTQENI